MDCIEIVNICQPNLTAPNLTGVILLQVEIYNFVQYL